MSLYRQAGRRAVGPIVAALVLGLLVGGAAGYLARGGGEEESLGDALAEVRERARPISAALELLPLEYGQARAATGPGGRTELLAARADLERARATFAAVREDLVLIDPSGARRFARWLDELDGLLERRASVRRVRATALLAERVLSTALGAK